MGGGKVWKGDGYGEGEGRGKGTCRDGRKRERGDCEGVRKDIWLVEGVPGEWELGEVSGVNREGK